MKNCTKSLFLILVGIFFASNFDAEQSKQTSTQNTHQKTTESSSKKLLLFGVKGKKGSGGILYPDLSNMKGGGFAALFGMTPEVVEEELFEVLQSLHVKGFHDYTGTYPMIIEAWLTNKMKYQLAQHYAVEHVKNNCGFFKKMKLKPAAEIAFSPYDAAKALSINHDIISVAQKCKAKGHTIAICSSWNKESFDAVKNIHYSAFAPFEGMYISGSCGILACESRFYDQFLKDYNANDIYLIDSLKENLTAAKQKGINTIYLASADALLYELKKQGIL
jgi:FMN phosphatase YigB (HAD superfamily)